jgi:hypothetical protein
LGFSLDLKQLNEQVVGCLQGLNILKQPYLYFKSLALASKLV